MGTLPVEFSTDTVLKYPDSIPDSARNLINPYLNRLSENNLYLLSSILADNDGLEKNNLIRRLGDIVAIKEESWNDGSRVITNTIDSYSIHFIDNGTTIQLGVTQDEFSLQISGRYIMLKGEYDTPDNPRFQRQFQHTFDTNDAYVNVFFELTKDGEVKEVIKAYQLFPLFHEIVQSALVKGLRYVNGKLSIAEKRTTKLAFASYNEFDDLFMPEDFHPVINSLRALLEKAIRYGFKYSNK